MDKRWDSLLCVTFTVLTFTKGPNWPSTGEIDIVEGVNSYTNDQSTIHTSPGCHLSSSDATTLGITGSVVGGTDCSSVDTGNQGCGIRASQNNSFGAGFNSNGGGVYASTFLDVFCLLGSMLTGFGHDSEMGFYWNICILLPKGISAF